MADNHLPKVAGGLDKSIADHERACLVLIDAEQRKLSPDNHIIATLCDSVRLAREYVTHRLATVARGEESKNAK